MENRKKKIFIHGSSGTTGLRIRERLSRRADLELLILPDEERRDPAAVKRALNESEAAFLCLPDNAAREAAAMLENPDTVLLDTSTAHRTAPGWTYGFPELSESHLAAVKSARRIAVPGCHASGFIALIYPLVSAGLLGRAEYLTCFSLTGYSGGGKKMIAQYEDENRDALLKAPRQYGLSQGHKHLPEMMKVCGLENAPVFCPVVADYYSGMEVTVPLFSRQLKGGAEDVKEVYRRHYRGPAVRYAEDEESGFLSAGILSGSDIMRVGVYGNEERLLLIARFDNLGKGASGAAVECLNLALGLEETIGLELGV